MEFVFISPEHKSCNRPDRRTRRREKNREAAQKSRKKQTERADTLHKELELLERANAAFAKEIAGLRRELQHYAAALRAHEPLCALRVPPAPAAAPPPGPGPSAPPPDPDLDLLLGPPGAGQPAGELLDSEWQEFLLTLYTPDTA
ncbi:basic leucine zipper transcriptional factor ATF-like 3 isoform X2 [Lepisosteus oculatus]|uniref:basic leucine zipper transcriptional factor ATF-like 3 isoform X2 n=1 Tax=Lepisosteus oculatus TaxID=7918 RepID=UPI0035F51F88